MTEWAPGTAPTTTWDQEAGMLPSGQDVTDNVESLVERAETAATNAETAETNAETAETNAETAQAAAESARDAAVVAKNAAETAEPNAETAQSAAEAAQTAAETAETNAETAESNAADSAADAQKLAINAEDSQYTLSDGSTTGYSALHYAAKAEDSATAASSAQSAAESARDATLEAYDNFDDRYLGAKASDPALDNDGNALIAGALYFNTTDELMKLYTGSAWVAAYVSVGSLTTDDLAEGSTNLYYTDARANSAIDTRVNKAFVDALNVDADTLDGVDSTGFATSAQGTLADSATQPGDNVSTLVNDAGYLTAETNDLTAAVTWANVPDANITESSVTQHEAALSITESQISDLGSYVTFTSSTGSAEIPVGTEAQRDGTPAAGMFRFNSDTSQFEGYNGTEWGAIAGGAGGGAGLQDMFLLMGA